MNKAGLIIIFNHKYNKNIEKLRKLYSSRFSYIKFIVPFYQGNDDDVICVYENSFQFQGYITQAYKDFYTDDISHYIFIGDDLILNPHINEHNFGDFLNVKEGESYIESLTPLRDTSEWSYQRFVEADLAFRQIGASYKPEIPSKEVAADIAHQYGFTTFSLSNAKFKSAGFKRQIIDTIRQKINKITLDYPLVTGYSDFLIISDKDIAEFTRLCGVFSAMRLWVEIAIPTAVMLSCKSVKTQKDCKYKTEKMWKPSVFVSEFEKKCGFQTENISAQWPEEYIYLHPVKLSKWN